MADVDAARVLALEQVVELEEQRRAMYLVRRLFPDAGPLRREKYAKHLRFFAAGAVHQERAFIAANRVGKSEAGTFECTHHLTGEYPWWWEGRRFETPVSMWAAGDTGKTTRDILQVKFLGPPSALGTGMIPAHLIVHKTPKSGVPDAFETIWVRHVPTGGTSVLALKSYDQRREAFQGTSQHVVLLDEECPEDIYTECLLRTMILPGEEQLDPEARRGGIVMLTFTPLMGLTPVVLSFLPGGTMTEGPVVEVAA